MTSSIIENFIFEITLKFSIENSIFFYICSTLFQSTGGCICANTQSWELKPIDQKKSITIRTDEQIFKTAKIHCPAKLYHILKY